MIGSHTRSIGLTTETPKIEAVDLHTNYRTVVILTGNVDVSKPRAIVLDPSTRCVGRGREGGGEGGREGGRERIG